MPSPGSCVLSPGSYSHPLPALIFWLPHSQSCAGICTLLIQTLTCILRTSSLWICQLITGLWLTLITVSRPDPDLLTQLSGLTLDLSAEASYHHHSWPACLACVLQDGALAGEASASAAGVTMLASWFPLP